MKATLYTALIASSISFYAHGQQIDGLRRLAYEKLISNDSRISQDQSSAYRQRLAEQNTYFNNELAKNKKLNDCSYFYGTQFIFRRNMSIVFENNIRYQDIVAVLFKANIVKSLQPLSSKTEPIYGSQGGFNAKLFLDSEEILNIDDSSLDIKFSFEDKKPKTTPEVGLRKNIRTVLGGSETMRTDGPNGFDTRAYDINPYGISSTEKPQIGTVEVLKFESALFSEPGKYINIFVQTSENGNIKKLEIQSDEIRIYPILYTALHQSRLLPEEYINPHNQYEIDALKAMKINSQSKAQPSPIKADHLTEFWGSVDGVLIIPDLHDDPLPLVLLLNLMQNNRVDWVAIEASSEAQQEFQEINKPGQSFEKGPQISKILENWIHVRRWNLSHLKADSKLLKRIKNRSDLEFIHSASSQINKPVVFMDANTAYISSRFCGDDLKHVTRNVVWANKIPSRGRGIVLGGSFHFSQNAPLNFQDFLANKYPNRKLFTLDF